MSENKMPAFKAAGNAAYQAGNFESALEFYSKAIELESSSHLLFSNRSITYFKLNRFVQSLRDAQKSVELEPKWPKGWLRVASAHRSLGRIDAAMTALEEGKNHNPDDAAIVSMLKECTTESRMMKTLGNIEPPPTLTSAAARDAIQYAAKLSEWNRTKMSEQDRKTLSHDMYMAPLKVKSEGDQTLWWKAFITHPSDPISKLEQIAWDSTEDAFIRKESREMVGAAAMWFAKVYVLYERSSKPLFHPLVEKIVKFLSIDSYDLRYGVAGDIAQLLNYDARRWGQIGVGNPKPPTLEQCERSLIFSKQFVNLGIVDKLVDLCNSSVPSLERTEGIDSALTALGRLSFLSAVRSQLKEKLPEQKESQLETIIRVACRDPDVQDKLTKIFVPQTAQEKFVPGIAFGHGSDRGLSCLCDLVVGPIQHQDFPPNMDAARLLLIHGGAGRMLRKVCAQGIIFNRILQVVRMLSSIAKLFWKPEYRADLPKLFAKQVSTKHLRHLLTLGKTESTRNYTVFQPDPRNPENSEEALLLKVHANTAMLTDVVGLCHARKLHQILKDGTLSAIIDVFVDMVNEGTIRALGSLAFRSPIAEYLSKHKAFMDILFIVFDNPDIHNDNDLKKIAMLSSYCIRCISVMSWIDAVQKRIASSAGYFFKRLQLFSKDTPLNSYAAQSRKYIAHLLYNIACSDLKYIKIVKQAPGFSQLMDFIATESVKDGWKPEVQELVQDTKQNFATAKVTLGKPHYAPEWWFDVESDEYPREQYVQHCARLACTWAATPGEEEKMWKDPKTGQKYCSESCAKMNDLDDQEFQI